MDISIRLETGVTECETDKQCPLIHLIARPWLITYIVLQIIQMCGVWKKTCEALQNTCP